MYGPPPDPRQVLAPVEVLTDPRAYAICVVVGGLVSALALFRRQPQALRGWWFVLGQVIVLTMPLAVFLDSYWYGSFPTVDKEGSLLFYLSGVHRTALLHPVAALSDPAVRLIGVHTGHLWVTAAFDLFLSPMGAFNAQALLYPALGWYCAWLLLRDLCEDPRVAMVMAFPWGMGLHVFRDLNWYTIEKAAIFWLALFAWAGLRAWRRGGGWAAGTGLVFLLMSWMNLYLGLVAGALGALAVLAAGWQAWRERERAGLVRLLRAAAWCAALGLPLALAQALLMRQGPALASPEEFLWQRAALDSFTLAPLRWNRLEVHRSLNLVGLGLALLGAIRLRGDPRVRFCLGAGLLLFSLALGPWLVQGLKNPIYLLAFTVVPGFWRVAKPEIFFHAVWLLTLGVAALELARELAPVKERRRGLVALYLLFAGAWVLMCRTHPAYPPMTRPVQSALAPDWEERVFGPG